MIKRIRCLHKKNNMVGRKRQPKRTKSQYGRGLASAKKQLRLTPEPEKNKDVVEEEEQSTGAESVDISEEEESSEKDAAIANLAGPVIMHPRTLRQVSTTTSPPCTATSVVVPVKKVNPVSPYASGWDNTKQVKTCLHQIQKQYVNGVIKTQVAHKYFKGIKFLIKEQEWSAKIIQFCIHEAKVLTTYGVKEDEFIVLCIPLVRKAFSAIRANIQSKMREFYMSKYDKEQHGL